MNSSYSLVTYTFNDEQLVRGLLEECRHWTLPPTEILVIDDGSKIPFVAEAPVRIIRIDPNRGPAAAKNAGISAATQKFILSIDADIRLDARWAELAIPLVSHEAVGLVGCPIIWRCGNHLTGRYLLHFEKIDPEKDGFISGGVWFLRRRTWREVGGFGEYSQRTHEDFAFSRRIANSGYALRSLAVPAHQVRRMGRHAFARRRNSYLGPGFRSALLRDPTRAIKALRNAVQARTRAILESKDFPLLYLELFLFLSLFIQGSGCSGTALRKLKAVTLPFLDRVPSLFYTLWKDLESVHEQSAIPATETLHEQVIIVVLQETLGLLFPRQQLVELEGEIEQELAYEERAISGSTHYLS
jgi:glycosyltransferase involved in cell wall biosynthesis